MAIKFTERKFYKYIYLRIVRQSGSIHSLALGSAIGTFFGFIVPIFQIPLAIFFAWIFRCNKILAAAFTWVSNPFTYAIVFPANVWVGSFFIESDLDMNQFDNFTFKMIFTDFMEIVKFFCSDGMLMFMTGGAILGAIFATLSYFFVMWFVLRHRGEKLTRFKLRREFLNANKNNMPGKIE